MEISSDSSRIDEEYRALPSLFFILTFFWFFSLCFWTFNTCKNRHFQTNRLQWTLATVPLIKTLQLTLSFLFWYSCFYHHICSLWISFGVYVTGVLFQTVTFVSFLLISSGYCITCERLSIQERRITAALGCIFYLTHVGFRASVPYFCALLTVGYFISFYVIFKHIAQNLRVLQEQLTFIEDEEIPAMHEAIYSKYTMLKKFRTAMHMMAVAELAILINVDNSIGNYWLRLLVREWAQFCILSYIGWTFRSKDMAPRFSVMPVIKSIGERVVPPIYSIEMDAATFEDFSSHGWHIGLPTSPKKGGLKNSALVVVQHPHMCRLTPPNNHYQSVA
ncbi:putative cytochrome c oxidase assembly protein COX19-like isoform X1 [Capsicum annuum]|uniref:uncharacterized protein LOC107861810 isoform X1 n=1 Tax=Capsicum annuum TaxID=4072 RepID=UPI001FB0E979|nr:uncharacterized protein LOC107861810 isoform X1 [Capsicum annuum]KAF3647303.1 putative cytochrome c oxidase assembly protein COX19-like isoform X1 [Capsicum annuum]